MPTNNSNSSAITIAKYIFTNFKQEFMFSELLEAGGITNKHTMVRSLKGYASLFSVDYKKETVTPNLGIFDKDPQKEFLNELKEQISICERFATRNIEGF
ncbi:MAG TPA: hypothetical protein VFI61_02920 [Patescibacteria group bacterium]|nr:hypothetical protein [Patescibacteria group bacterium]